MSEFEMFEMLAGGQIKALATVCPGELLTNEPKMAAASFKTKLLGWTEVSVMTRSKTSLTSTFNVSEMLVGGWTKALVAVCPGELLTNEPKMAAAPFKTNLSGWTEALVVTHLKILTSEFVVFETLAGGRVKAFAAVCPGELLTNEPKMAAASFKTKLLGWTEVSVMTRSKTSLTSTFNVSEMLVGWSKASAVIRSKLSLAEWTAALAVVHPGVPLTNEFKIFEVVGG